MFEKLPSENRGLTVASWIVACAVLIGMLPSSAATPSQPISTTGGFNQDLIAENTAPDQATGTSTDFGSWVFYESGFPGTSQGLPLGATPFVSLVNPNVTFQLQPYAGNNVVRGGGFGGTLTLVSPARYKTLNFLSTSQNSTMSVIVSFSDNTFTTFSNITVPDWTQNSNPNSIALANIGLIQRGNNSIYNGGLSLFEQDISLTAADQAKLITAITVNGTGNYALFAVSGEISVPAITTLIANNSVDAGGNLVTIVGSGLLPGSTYSFVSPTGTAGPVTATSTSSDGKVVTLIVPPSVPAGYVGDVDFVYSGPNGTLTITNGFTYTATPIVINSVTPSHGAYNANTIITIKGSGFAPFSGNYTGTVQVGLPDPAFSLALGVQHLSSAIQSATVISGTDSQIVCKIPPQLGATPPGLYDIFVTATSNTSNNGPAHALNAYKAGVFTYDSYRVPENDQNFQNTVHYRYFKNGQIGPQLPSTGTPGSGTDNAILPLAYYSPTIAPTKQGFTNTLQFNGNPFNPPDNGDNYSVEFVGFLNVPADGVYTFFTTCDDSSYFVIGDTTASLTVVRNNITFDGGQGERSGIVGLKVGRHRFAVQFSNRNGGNNLNVSWQGPTFAKENVPQGSPDGTARGFYGELPITATSAVSTPAIMPLGGGSPVTVTGTNFYNQVVSLTVKDSNNVTLGTFVNPAAAPPGNSPTLTIVSPTQITFNSPPDAFRPGAASVTITTLSGQTVTIPGGLPNGLFYDASGITKTWTGANGSPNWSEDSNWSGNVAPENGDFIVLTSSGQNPTNMDIPGLSLNGLTYSSAANQSFIVTETTGAGLGLTFAGSGATITLASGAAAQTINLNTILSVPTNVVFNPNANLTLSGLISGAGSLGVSGGATLTVTNGANTYSGGTAISNGAVFVTPNIANGGVPSGIGTSSNATGNLQINNATLSIGSTSATDHNMTFGVGTATINTGTFTVTLNGSLSGPGNLRKIGAGTLALAATNSYAGSTIIDAGTVRLTSVAGAPGIYEQALAGSFNLGSPFDINQATVQQNTRKANTNSNVQFPDNTTYLYQGFINTSSDVTWTFAENFDDSVSLIIDGQQLLLDGTYNNPTKAHKFLSAGSHAFELRLGEGGGGVGPVNGGLFNGGVGGLGFGIDRFVVDSTNPNDYVAADNAIIPGLFTLTANAIPLPSTTAVIMNTNTILDLNGLKSTIGSLADAAGNPTGASMLLGNGSITLGNDNTSTKFSGVISATDPASGLTKIGTGTQTLNGVNTYAGPTIINAGKILLGNANAIANSTVNLNVDNGLAFSTNSAIYNIGGLTGTNNESLQDTNGAAITLVAGGGPTNPTTTYGGVLTGLGNFTKAGTGTLTLTNNSTYAGNTAITSGILKLRSFNLPVPGASLWLNADHIESFTFGAGNSITGWSNEISSTGSMVGTGTYLPSDINGRPAIHFNANDTSTGGANPGNFMRNGVDYAPACTMFAVARETGGANNRVIGSVGSNFLLGFFGGQRDKFYFDGWVYGANGGEGNNPDTLPHMYETSIGGGAVPSTAVAYDNRGLTIFTANTGNDTGGNRPPAGLQLNGNGGGECSDCNIAEVLIYPGLLNATDRATIENYLAVKYFGSGATSQNNLPVTTNLTISGSGVLDTKVNQTVASISSTDPTTSLILNSASVITGGSNTSTPFAGVVSGSGNLTKTGTGTFTLTGANTYTGTTNIKGGTLAGNTASIGTSTAIAIDNTAAQNSTLQAIPSGFVLSAPITLTGSATVDTNGNDSALNGSISGTGDLNKAGAGILSLSGNNTYAGATRIKGGTLKLLGSIIAGLYEGSVPGNFNLVAPIPHTAVRINAKIDPSDPAFSVTPRANNNFNAGVPGGFPDFTTYGYVGLLVTTGTTHNYTFAANFDDNTYLKIDNTVVLNVGFNGGGAAFKGNIVLAPGTHTFEVRFGEGGGGVGPAGDRVFGTGLGFGWDPQGRDSTNGADFQALNDPGDGSVFNTGDFQSSLPPATPVIMSSNTTLDVGTIHQFAGSLADAGPGTTGHKILMSTGGLTIGADNSSTSFAGVISGTAGLTKTGTGTQTFAGANTFSGATAITNGAVQLANSNALQNSTVTVNANNALLFAPIAGATFNIGGLAGSGNEALQDTGAAAISLVAGGGINPSTTSYSGVLSGPGSFTKAGAGILTLTNISTYLGNTAITGGTLRLAANTPTPGSILWLNADDVSKFDPGTANISPVTTWAGESPNVNTTMNGNGIYLTNVNNGHAAVQFNNNNGTVNPPNAATFMRNNTIYQAPVTMFAVANMIGGTNGRIIGSNDSNFLLGWWAGRQDVAHFSTWVTKPDGAGPNADTLPHMYETLITGPNGANANAKVFVADSARPTVTQIADFSANYNAPRNLQLNGNGGGDFSDCQVSEVLIYQGLLNAEDRAQTETYLIARYFGGGNPTPGNLPSTTAVTITGGGVLDVRADQTVASISTTDPTSGLLLHSANLTTGGDNSSKPFAGIVSGTGNLTKIGTGTFSLTGVNTYTGSVIVDAGTVQANATALSNAGKVVIDNTLGLASTLQAKAGAGGQIATSSTVTLIGTATVDTNGTLSQVDGAVSGTGTLGKIGLGTLTLTGSNTFSGGATVTAGVLAAGTAHLVNTDPFGTGPVTLAGGNLALQGATIPAATGLNIELSASNATISDYASLAALNARFLFLNVTKFQTTLGGKTNLDFSNVGFGTGAPFLVADDPSRAAYGFNSGQFEVRLSGYFFAAESGVYTFKTQSDDGSTLFLDDDAGDLPVVNNNGDHGPNVATGTQNLTAGLHKITIGFFEHGGGRGLLVQYAPPSAPATFVTMSNSELHTTNVLVTTPSPTQLYPNSVVINQNATITVNNALSASLGNFTIGANTLILNGDNTASLTLGNGSLTGNAIFAPVASTTLTVGALSDSVPANPNSITKNDVGTLVLKGQSTYGLGTNINAGTVQLFNTNLPTGLSPQIWLDASAAATVVRSGSNVTAWNDKSGNNENVTPVNPLTPPVYNASNPVFNGLPTLTFGGTNALSGFDATFLNNSSYTIFAVEGKTNTNNNYFLGTNPGGNTNQSLHFGYRNDTDFTFAQYGNDLDCAAPAFVTQVAREWTGKFDSTTGHFIYLNGAVQASNGDKTGFNGQGPGFGYVGAAFGKNAPYSGDLAEILIFASALTDVQRTGVDAYLQQKWGLAPSLSGHLPVTTDVTLSNSAKLDLNGVNQTIGSLTSAVATTNVALGSGILTVNSTNANTVFAGGISDTGGANPQTGGGLVMQGTKELKLTGTGTYSGETTVSGGTLVVDGLLNGTSATNVANGATLRGTGNGTTTGTIQTGVVTVSGTIFPGDTPNPVDAKGTLTVNGLAINANGIVKIRASGTPASVTIDTLAISGSTATLAVGASLELRNAIKPGNYADALFPFITMTGSPLTTTFTNITVPNQTLTPNANMNVSVAYNGGDLQSIAPDGTYTTGGGSTTAPVNLVQLKLGNAVTPVTIDSIAARAEGAGVVVEWKLVSEYMNLGFNVYRRPVDLQSKSAWTKINPAMIPGQLTSPSARTYRIYDWPAQGAYEYRLESVDTGGSGEFYRHLAGPVTVDGSGLSLTEEGLDAAIQGLSSDNIAARGAELSAQFAQQQNDAAGAENAATAPIAGVANVPKSPERATARLALDVNGSPYMNAKVQEIAAATPRQAYSTETPGTAARGADSSSTSLAAPGMLPRYLPKPSSGGGTQTLAKVVCTGSGVLMVPQSSLPSGFNANNLRIQREGRTQTALAVTPAGVLLYAPGYSDAYTDNDVFFLANSNSATPAGSPMSASGLFTGGKIAASVCGASVTEQFHDTYFDWSLRPYDYPPYFSSQYLTQGGTANFALNLESVSSGSASLTVYAWSLTSETGISPDHALQAFVNGKPVGQAVWSGGGRFVSITFDVPTGTLKAGSNAIALTTPALNGVTSQIALVHSLSVSYNKNLTGPGATEIVNSSNVSQLFELSNLSTANLWVVDTRFPDRAALVPYETAVQADGSIKARFNAAAGGTGKFLLVPAGSEMQPLAVTKRVVKPLATGRQYLATGPNQFATSVQPLLMMHGKEGIKGAFVDQEQLFDYYNYGRYGPSGIQKAVQATRPQYLLLVGRTNYDYHNYSGASVDPLCPSFLVSTTFWSQTTSDATFGDLGRGYPEVRVGRLPVNNAAEAAIAVNHVLNYHGVPSSGFRAHISADIADPLAGDFAAEAEDLVASNPEVSWTRNYLGITYQTAAEATESMRQAACGGADLLIYNGHGSAIHLGANDPHILDTDSVQTWTGDVVFIAATCTFNWVAKVEQNYRSIPIQALVQPQGGMAASIGTTTYMDAGPDMAFVQQLLTQMNSGGSKARWGDVLLKAQQWAYFQGQNGTQSNGNWYQDLSRTECIMGDPAMSVFGKSNPTTSNNPTNPTGPATGTTDSAKTGTF